jgi:hypothetical protein
MEAAMISEDGCECCGGEAEGMFGLCSGHLDQWLRSPERRAVPDLSNYGAWTAALERFIKRIQVGGYVN